MLEIEEILSRFDGVRSCGRDRWMAKCPCHDDRVQSLSIAVGSNGTVLMDCHAGCAFRDIIAAVGLSVGDVTAGGRKKLRTGFDYMNVVATYDYGNGTRKLRDAFKGFTWQHMEDGMWVPGRGDAPHCLYRRGEEQETVYVVEGEKDADNLSRTGLFCVSGENGAGGNSNRRKWFPEYSTELAGKAAVIIPDNDETGRAFAKMTAAQLIGTAESVRVLDLKEVWEDIPEKGDISDMLKSLGEEETLSRLSELVSGTESLTEDSAVLADVDNSEDVKKLLKTAVRQDRNGGEYTEVLDMTENYLQILRNDNRFRSLRFNTMRGNFDRLADGICEQWTDSDDSWSRAYFETVYGLFNVRKSDDAFLIFQRERAYHPVQELISSITWDGKPRVEEMLIKWMRCEDTPYNRECSRLLFAGGIQRAFNPGCQFDVTVVLKGMQGGGKSTFCRYLALDDVYYTSTKTISGKMGMEAIQGKWIVEIEELLAVIANEKGGQKTEEKAKAFLTGQSDYYRAPYGRRSTDHPRNCIFIGTTNRDRFLTDKTGNRRWYPVDCGYAASRVEAQQYGACLHEHRAEMIEDIRQSWAEMLSAYRNGEPLAVPTPRSSLLSEINRQQSEAEVEDWRIGVIEDYLETHNKDRVCIKELWDMALHPGASFIPELTPKDSREIAEILRHVLGWTKCTNSRFNDYGTQKAFHRPVLYPILDDDTSDLPF